MANVNTVRCDRPGCGKLKGEINHWWTIEGNIISKSMLIYPYDEQIHWKMDSSWILLRACGLECLSIIESKIKGGVNPLK